MFKFPSESNTILTQLKSKIITKFSSIYSKHRFKEYVNSEGYLNLFSKNPNIYIIYAENFGTITFKSVLNGNFSLGISYNRELPSHEKIVESVGHTDEIVIIKASDTTYSTPYMASFVGSRIDKIEIAKAHPTGRMRPRLNERGIRITNDKGMQLIVGRGLVDGQSSSGLLALPPDRLDQTPGMFTFQEV
ncbi:hypothetical protein ACETRX_20100 [Labrys portucalensis]|uniref:Uncharacterized protein n=1 Tax=Labrys neptuniae TaxID=376174 RepID=A0ABV6ZIE5_9HYPH